MVQRAPEAPPPPFLEIRAAGAPLEGTAVARCELFLAADRPDRLEVELVPLDGRWPQALGALRPGAEVAARLGGRDAFRGVADRVAEGRDALRGRTVTLVAYAAYHRLRGSRPRHRDVEVTDSEAAERIAAELGLVAKAERTARVHPVLEREGDPLRFLRGRARALGFQLAVTQGRLHFAQDALAPGPALRAAQIVSLEVVARAGGRGGVLDLRGDPRMAPLAGIELPGVRGGFRVVRALHSLGREGYLTRVEFLEDGLDLARWSGSGEARGVEEVEHDPRDG